jgi:hypothetical protein
MKCDEEIGSRHCHDLTMERIRYFTGRHMAARDFHDADAYHRSFRHLHNRVLHGWGIACGLEVERHWRRECRGDRVVVRCGMAIDCCGREVLLRADVVSRPIPWDERPTIAGSDRTDQEYLLLLCLRYHETCVERVPVLYSPTACSSPTMEDGRVREGYQLCWRWVHRDRLKEYGWDAPETCAPRDDDDDEQSDDGHYGSREHQHKVGVKQHEAPPHAEPPRHDPCDDDEPEGCCLDPLCPPDHCVPLAIIRAKTRDDMDTQDDIDVSGRRSIAQAREHLTHICWLSWKHGGLVRARDLHSLRVRFDRPLLPPESPGWPGPRGINERTFVAQWGEQLEEIQTEDIDYIEYRTPPYLTPDRRMAVYEIRKPMTYSNHVIHVTLKCDFILDCRRNPVDGDHLGGRLPTGNRVPGGTFESWFRAVDDETYNRLSGNPGSKTAEA